MSLSKALSRAQLQAVLQKVQKLYPVAYADSAWDNTGLLIDCTVESSAAKPRLLLAVDLTAAVAREAIEKECNMILAYHPFIFPSWKKLDPWANSQHRSAVQLIQHGISVYCPHTAVDAAKGGVNDWLVQTLQGEVETCTAIERVTPLQGEEEHEVGYGRLVHFREPLSLAQIVQHVKRALGVAHVQISTAKAPEDHLIQNVALCAGSGSGVFKGVSPGDVDLYYTGELSHHEILRYREAGKAVIVCNHSNTERGYLRDVMYKHIQELGVECHVSAADVDPLQVM
ncbi:AGR233Wp [Eremothecium gossypii ATCC 10895]|uniref:AGR233Wp n=1 Tax=Eremothecium gossypii (strain ATCC 10895 / CBS 109.51 / FGSC 9923 / NRRL Y-1056) TaxID=284811 RepID=Q74ZH4_EREGS|nr:AGR233Wp [Eremothecium gossypii ATCC 10895]AAS54723.1 AGR233Wp [Eremothecium gossypii ATCC 10895]